MTELIKLELHKQFTSLNVLQFYICIKVILCLVQIIIKEGKSRLIGILIMSISIKIILSTEKTSPVNNYNMFSIYSAVWRTEWKQIW